MPLNWHHCLYYHLGLYCANVALGHRSFRGLTLTRHSTSKSVFILALKSKTASSRLASHDMHCLLIYYIRVRHNRSKNIDFNIITPISGRVISRSEVYCANKQAVSNQDHRRSPFCRPVTHSITEICQSNPVST